MIGGLESQNKDLGCTDTPQGSVILPMLFNLVLSDYLGNWKK